MTRIDDLRKQIRESDASLIEIIGTRLRLAAEIGELKKQSGIPLKDYEVEKTVLESAAAAAENNGVPADLAREVMRALIRESCIEQERLSYSGYKGDLERILVIGGGGGMGQWLCGFFAGQGHSVTVLDPRGAEGFQICADLKSGIESATCIAIATPLETVPDMIRAVADSGFRGVAFDIASLKGFLTESLAYAKGLGVQVCSIHPMFGPSVRTLSDRVICFCDCGSARANAVVEGFFSQTAVSRVRLSIDEHDRAVSYVLGLSHLINVVFMDMLVKSDFSYQDLLRIASTTFLSQMVTTESVIRENPELYYAIQQLNPFRERLYAELKTVTAGLTDAVLDENPKRFCDSFAAGAKWLIGDKP
ncbi:MAG: prephenate dehydrogenase/arogenate dehydrogenase family protein [Candidatus Wallbacteria bacterium]|nr:prephenate dehydrogenase/arogenate dehydrogenase family protein [Candidatus Wallbacteria bacterium]